MSKDKDIFGEVDNIPESVGQKLMDPGFSAAIAEDIEVEADPPPLSEEGKEAPKDKESLGGFDEMFNAENIEDLIEKAEQEDFDGEDFDDTETFSFDISDLEPELLIDLWEEIRGGLHASIYEHFVYKHPKEAKKVIQKLSLKDQKTDQEKQLLKELFAYVEQHDEIRRKYMNNIPYSERHKALLTRMLNHQLKKMNVQGKTVPTWMIWSYLIVAPEVKMAATFWKLKDEIPPFSFDINSI